MRRFRLLPLVAVLSVSGFRCGLAAEDPVPSWAGGRPPELAADNPYLKTVRAFAAREYSALAKGEKHNLVFPAWSLFVDPESAFRGDAAVRTALFDAFDAVTRVRAEKPSGYWTILEDTEVFNLWRLYGGLTPEQLATWKERLRPSYEAALASITDESQWMSKAANTLFQTALSLEFGAVIYGALDPNDPDPARWRAQARKNVERGLAIQLPGGAFSYINDSGPDPVYFNFDAAHLGRYYQITADPSARAALVAMARWADAATISGQLTPFASPWWKHSVGLGGPYTGFEHVAALVDDPLALDLARQRRAHIQPYVWTLGNLYAWRARGLPPAPSRDRCRWDENANGPALRVGGYDVELPARAWGDSAFGVSVSSERSVTSHLNAVYLAVPGKLPREGHMSHMMLGPADVPAHAGVVGDGWVAGAGTLYAHRAIFGQTPPATSPFRRTELWFADADGAAGSLEFSVEAEVRAPGVELWLRTAVKPETLKLSANRVEFADFAVTVSGAAAGAPFVDKGGVYLAVGETGERRYRAGETFAAQVAVTRPGRPVLAIGPLARDADGIVSTAVTRDGAFRARLRYNPHDRPVGGLKAHELRAGEADDAARR